MQFNTKRLTVDLSGTRGLLAVEWFNPATGKVTMGVDASGGGSVEFTAPFQGDAVLYVYVKARGVR